MRQRPRTLQIFGAALVHEARVSSSMLERIPVTLNHFSRVMAGQQPVEDIRASTPVFDGLLRERPYVPAIHALLAEAQHKRRGCPRRQACAACVNLAASAGMTVEG